MPTPTAHQIAADLAGGNTTSVEVTGACLRRARQLEPTLSSFLHLCEEQALQEAAASDQRRAQGRPLSPLDGVPIALKDNIITEGVRTCCASRILENFVPPFDGTVPRKLREAGMVLLGKTNLDEFAMGSSTENSAFGRSCNPWDTGRVVGGSSGGSASAVASGQVPCALGSDTGGSIRQPASFCGITGLKPTYGRVSRYGLISYASSLDQIGPMTLDVEDAALLLDIIAGHDPLDSTSARLDVPGYTAALREGSLKGKKIAVPREFFEVEGLDDDVRAVLDQAAAKVASAGAELFDVSMPHLKYSVACYYLIATAEASSNLARFDGAHYGYRAQGTKDIVEMFSRTRAEAFGKEVKRRIMMGTHALSAGYYDAYYLKALKTRTLIKGDYDRALEQADFILAPTSPFPAFPAGSRLDDPLAMYLADIFTLSLNMAGYCGISLPAGFSGEGLPIGVQLMGGAFREDALLQAAWQVEQLLGVVGTRQPAVCAV